MAALRRGSEEPLPDDSVITVCSSDLREIRTDRDLYVTILRHKPGKDSLIEHLCIGCYSMIVSAAALYLSRIEE